MKNTPRSDIDPILRRHYRALLPQLRAYLYQRGHAEAAKDLAGVSIEDVEASWEDLKERVETRPDSIPTEEVIRIHDAIFAGIPQERPSIFPSASIFPYGADRAEDPAPRRGEIRVIDGKECRFIERELEGDKWEIIGPVVRK